jgi:predicted outer membrane repeat protein
MFRDNTGTNGGAIHNLTGVVIIEHSSFYENSGTGEGGAIANQSELYVTNTTFSKNEAEGSGGGIASQGKAVVANVTLSENIADKNHNGGDGGGLFNAAGSTFVVRNSVVGGNGDQSFNQQALNLRHDCAGAFTSGGNNLIAINNGCTGFTNGVNGDKVGIIIGPVYAELNPVFVNDAHVSYSLKPTSPARNAGNPAGCTDAFSNAILKTDQRHYARVGQAPCDMGSIESDSNCAKTPSPVLFAPANKTKIKNIKPTLDWMETDCAQTYRIVVRKDSPTGLKVAGGKDLVPTKFQTGVLVPGTKYFWQVKACNMNNKCSKTEWSEFRVQ